MKHTGSVVQMKEGLCGRYREGDYCSANEWGRLSGDVASLRFSRQKVMGP